MATYGDLLREPEPLVAEIIEGELYTTPRPPFRHARAMSRLAWWLGRWCAFEIAPDWIREIESDRKMPRYAHHGINHAWLVDLVQRTLVVFRLEQRRWSLIATHRGDAAVRAEPFDEVELPLARLWVFP